MPRHPKKKRPSQRTDRSAAPRQFDVAMIRDFLDYLLLDLRASHYEETGGSERSLAERLAPYARKYGCVVQESSGLGGGFPSALAKEEANRYYSGRNRQARDEQLLHLEALRPVLEEALRSPASPAGTRSA